LCSCARALFQAAPAFKKPELFFQLLPLLLSKDEDCRKKRRTHGKTIWIRPLIRTANCSRTRQRKQAEHVDEDYIHRTCTERSCNMVARIFEVPLVILILGIAAAGFLLNRREKANECAPLA
jgi:hypothetical protein